MSHDYRQTGHRMGSGREALVDAVAAYHHANESIHMHENVGSDKPCAYCWLRAGRAVQILAQQGALLDGPLAEVRAERARQDAQWGEQNHPDGTHDCQDTRAYADMAREWCQSAAEAGQVTWQNILNEEVAELFAEEDPAKLRTELIQVAAVALAWVEAIDRRTAEADQAEES
ncbi:hypothetical protein ACWEQG_01645 [Microbispora sp. NPDC004025]